MQPYFFPYVGYFQLAAAVDTFVFHDDVQFTKKGWINRNRILHTGRIQPINLPLLAAPSGTNINKREIFNPEETKLRICRQIEGAYRHAPYFSNVFPFLKDVIVHPSTTLSTYLQSTLIEVFRWLNLSTKILQTSDLPLPHGLTGEARVIAVCEHMKAALYINPPGGQGLYHPTHFTEKGIHLHFLNPQIKQYPQPPGTGFMPSLSIIDLMMYNSQDWVCHAIREIEIQ
jgi:hypothetical protein